jgi:type I restriction enzyme S subunit
LGELNPGWTRVKFGQVVRQVKDKTNPETSGLERFVAGEHMDSNDLRIRRWGDIGDGYLGPAFHMHFRPGQVLYGSRRTYLRKVAVADFEGICANTTFVLESADPKLLLPELLPFIMTTEAFHEHSKRESKGSVNPYVNFSDLAWYEFALPPLEEQRRISALLGALRNVVDRYVDVWEGADTTLRSLGKEFFIIAPEGERATVGAFADVRNGTTPRRNVEAYWGGTIPWLPTGKVNERRITSADEFITEKALQECSLGGVLPVGAALVAMIGEGITRGKVARLALPACINQNFAAVVPRDGLDSWYLFYYLESHYESLRRWSQGTNQQALNCALVRAFPIVVPHLSRQREIAGTLREVDDRVTLAAARLADARERLHQVSSKLLSMGLS